jgi:membrane peptidoglycan carboxypeptidase
MSSTNIKTAVELGIITLEQASALLKQEISEHERQQPTARTNKRPL